MRGADIVKTSAVESPSVVAPVVESVVNVAPTGVVPPIFAPGEAQFTATSSAFTVIPVPAPTINVTAPESPPPVSPAPAKTPVISPVVVSRFVVAPLDSFLY